MKLFGESSPDNLDFKQWVEMAKNDPELFENLRQKAINEVIEKAPEAQRQRLRCLQWRIDQERNRSQSALGLCLWISRLMWESVTGRGGLFESLTQVKEIAHGGELVPPPAKADVLPFRSRLT
ncbi:MAG: DUF3135 domain-containing protein [Gammaproteobacteria bacterium]|nr:DUF3135 domain-containing protein [Gammaproteobacteria bacterium]